MLESHRRFLEADDEIRSDVLAGETREALTALVAAVEPLFDEINRVLNRFDATSHPLPGDLELLEQDLHSLAQAAMEAKDELDARSR